MNKTKKCSSYRSKSSVHEVPGPLSCGDNCSDFYRLLKLYRHFTAASAFQASDRFRAPHLRVTRCQICQRGCSSCDSPFSSRLHVETYNCQYFVFTRPLIQKGSSLQEEILAVCLSVCLSVITFSFYKYSII